MACRHVPRWRGVWVEKRNFRKLFVFWQKHGLQRGLCVVNATGVYEGSLCHTFYVMRRHRKTYVYMYIKFMSWRKWSVTVSNTCSLFPWADCDISSRDSVHIMLRRVLTPCDREKTDAVLWYRFWFNCCIMLLYFFVWNCLQLCYIVGNNWLVAI